MLDLDIFGLEFENNIVVFEMIILKFVKLQSFSEKKISTFRTKNAFSEYFRAISLKSHCHI